MYQTSRSLFCEQLHIFHFCATLLKIFDKLDTGLLTVGGVNDDMKHFSCFVLICEDTGSALLETCLFNSYRFELFRPFNSDVS